MPILRIENLEFRYNGFKALDNITFNVERGDIVSILGPNGSGKTTLLRTIDGILKPFKGTVYLDFKNIRSLSRLELAKEIGFVPQRVAYNAGVTVLDFVLTGRRPHVEFAPTRTDVEVALKSLRLVDAEHLAERDILELSGGEFQRVLIARALAVEPRILLLDEPTASLDLRFQYEILNLIRDLSEKNGLTVLMSLHDLTQAYRYTTKALLLKSGRIFRFGTTPEVLTEENIREVYGISVQVDRKWKAIIPV